VRAAINGVSVVVNGTVSPTPIGLNRPISDGGQLVLGQLLKYGRRSGEIIQHQTSTDASMFEEHRGFVGELGFVNIWGHVLTSSDIIRLHADCDLIYCGDVIEWADFRTGRTRGKLRVLWPSKIFSSHSDATFSESEKFLLIDSYATVSGDIATGVCNAYYNQRVTTKRGN
jgi:Pentaxin family